MAGGTRTLVAVAEAGTQFTCFSGTKVQILTQKAVRDIAAADVSLRELELGAAGVVEIVSALILANAHGRQVVPSLLALLVLVQKVQILTREEALRAPPHELLALIQALRSMAFDCAKFTCLTSTKVRILTRARRRCVAGAAGAYAGAALLVLVQKYKY
jgi:hypothetical protein